MGGRSDGVVDRAGSREIGRSRILGAIAHYAGVLISKQGRDEKIFLFFILLQRSSVDVYQFLLWCHRGLKIFCSPSISLSHKHQQWLRRWEGGREAS